MYSRPSSRLAGAPSRERNGTPRRERCCWICRDPRLRDVLSRFLWATPVSSPVSRPGRFGLHRRGVPWTPGRGLGTQTHRLDDPRTVGRSWGSPKRGHREERLVTALIVLRVSAVTLKNAFCCFLQKPKSCSWFPVGPELGGIASPVLLGASGTGTRTGAAVLQVTQTRRACLPKQSVLLCRVPLRALPVRVPDPAAPQPLGFCREPASDGGQTRRWLSAATFPGCGSCRRRAACALAAPRGSAVCRARGLLAHGAAGVGAAVAAPGTER
ncbi:uncharacterized protein LOC115344052 [Aquila chrysaetos chrysaetos]|uniref:uncharacterized protein LOC115344052 n=1 Tax=Aquila chrysaetos chrysaetos TaxID=223781 RepID=UPI001B7D3C79|nr:uncharacterized protein LOC115344052 [Aquila chrysaetos chrysaetos]